MKGRKNTIVGRFFEELTGSVLGGRVLRDEDGDVVIERSMTTIEVKSSSNESSYGFRLDTEQIKSYVSRSQFPFDRAWYTLFSYQNRRLKGEDGVRHTELSEHDDVLSINRYLSRKVIWCVIVDLSIIKGWKNHFPHSTKSVMGHLGTETVDVKSKVVHHIANGGFADRLKEINLDPGRFIKGSGKISVEFRPDLFSQYKLDFPLIAILPSEDYPILQRRLKRRGFTLLREDR